MIKSLICSVLFLSWTTLFAQKASVMQALKNYNISEEVLNTNLMANLEKFPHEVSRTVTIADKAKEYKSFYDPKKLAPSQWTLVTVNGKVPSKSEQKAFAKEHDQKLDFKIDDSSFKIAKDDGKTLEITYQYDPSSLDKDHAFLKDCLYTLHINAITGRLERLTEENLKDLRIKILKVTKMITEINYGYLEKDKIYVPLTSTIEIVIKMLGNEMPMLTSEKYKIK